VLVCVCNIEQQGEVFFFASPILFVIQVIFFFCFLVVLSIMYPFIIVVKFYGHFCHLFMVFFGV